MASLVVGSVCIVLIMLVFPEKPWPRDLLWSVGVAALVFTLIVNRMLKKAAEKADGNDKTA